MKKVCAVIAVVCMSLFGLRYGWLIWQGEIQPVLATWILFCVATSLSMWTYWSSEKHSLIGNIGNTIDVVLTWIVLLMILVLGRNMRLGFNLFDIGCLAASGVILVFWRWSRRHALSNLALQAVLVVAYLPTFYQLWYAPKNTESFSAWSVSWLATAAALVPPILTRDKLATVYAVRAFTGVTIVLALMLRLELRAP